MPRLVPLPALLISVVAGGCVTTIHRPQTTPVRDVLPESRPLLVALPSDYGTPVDPPQPGDETLDGLLEALVKRHGAEARDPRLDRFAMLHAQAIGITNQMPAKGFAEWLKWKLGITDEIRAVWATFGSGSGSRKALVDWLDVRLQEHRSDGHPLSWGVGAVHLGGGRFAAALAIGERFVSLDPLSRKQGAGKPFTLSGRLNVPLADATLFVDDGDAVLELPFAAAKGGAFSIEIPPTAVAGRRLMELVGRLPAEDDEHAWLTTVLLLPVYVDVEEPTEPDPLVRQPPPNPAEISAWPARLKEIYDAARAARSLPPLADKPRLVEVATKTATQIGSSFENAPATGAAEQLARAGLPTKDLQLFASRTEFLEETARRNIQRPSVRSALLQPDTSLFGAHALAIDNLATLVEIFAATPPTRDHVKAAATHLRRLQDWRAKHDLPPYERDAELQKAADTAAADVCSGKVDPDGLDLGAYIRLSRIVHAGTGTFQTGGWIDRVHIGKQMKALLRQNFTHAAAASCRGAVTPYPDGEIVLFFMIR